MIVNVVYGFAYFLVVLFECGLPKYFPSRIILGQCLARQTTDGLSYTHAVIVAISDVIFAVLPLLFVWEAALSRRAKISVGAILTIGSL